MMTKEHLEALLSPEQFLAFAESPQDDPYRRLVDRMKVQLQFEDEQVEKHAAIGRKMEKVRCAMQTATVLRRILREAGEME